MINLFDQSFHHYGSELMKKFKKIEGYKQNEFIDEVNKAIENINKLVEEYNGLFVFAERKKKILLDIYSYYQEIINQFPGGLIAKVPEYKEIIFIDMFQEIQKEFKTHGLTSLTESSISDYELHALNPKKQVLLNFAKLLKSDSEGITFFLGSLDESNLKYYKFQKEICNFIKNMAKEDNPDQMYKDLDVLKRWLHINNATLGISSERKNKLRDLIQAINTKLHQLEDKHKDTLSRVKVKVPPKSFPEFIANMTHDKASQMARMLAAVSATPGTPIHTMNLKNIFSTTGKGKLTEEDKLFCDLIDNLEIIFLGGGNSKNFKVTDHTTGSVWVLKVDNRLGSPKDIEARLAKTALSGILTTLYADKQVSFEDSHTKEVVTRGLLVTEYCSGGDLVAHSALQTDTSSRIRAALSIYSQMAQALVAIGEKKAAFPDMKNTNWLIDANGKLRIADTKSFVPATNGIINFKDEGHKWYKLPNTRYMNSPEMDDNEFDAGAMHAYMLGKNLYQYLSRCNCSDLEGEHNGSGYNFSAPEFNTEEGKELKELIIDLIQPKPRDRLSVEKALNVLKPLLERRIELEKQQLKDLKRECGQLVKEIITIDKDQHTKIERIENINKIENLKDLEFLQNQLNFKLLEVRETYNKLHDECEQIAKNIVELDPGRNYKQRIDETKNIQDFTSLKSQLELVLVSIKKTKCSELASQIHTLNPDWDKESQEDQILSADNILSIEEIYKKLSIQHTTLKERHAQLAKECGDLLTTISTSKFGDKDTLLKQFITEHREKIGKARDINSLNGLKDKLTTTQQSLTLSNEIKKIIEHYRKHASWHSFFMAPKANKIEQAMLKVPVEQRGEIFTSKDPKALGVQEALATHRHLGKRGTVYYKGGEIDESKAANSFKDLKSRFFNQRKKPERLDKEHSPYDRNKPN